MQTNSDALLVRAAESYGDEIYKSLGHMLASTIALLDLSPPPCDRALARKALGDLIGSIFGIVSAALCNGILAAFTARKVPASAIDIVKEQLAHLTATVNDEPRRPALAPEPIVVTRDPGAHSLLDDLAARSRMALNQKRARTKSRLLLAEEKLRQSHPDAVRPLLEVLELHAGSSELATAFQQALVIGWLNFCASASLGSRMERESLMPDANKIGGSTSWEWRRVLTGFIEIDVDFAESVRGLDGVTLGKVRVGSSCPGTAELLREMQIPLDQLPVHRRIWIGRRTLNRLPDIVIKPDHGLEVNCNSSLLAAIATGAHGPLTEILLEGRGEEAEHVRLLKAHPGPSDSMGSLLSAGTMGQELERIECLSARRQSRAKNAQQGAAKLVAWLHQFTTETIVG